MAVSSGTNPTDYVVDGEICRLVASRIGFKWKSLARMMGLGEARLDNIQLSSHDLQEMAYQTILAWKQVEVGRATVNVLAEYLKDVGRTDIAQAIIKMVRDKNPVASSTKIPHTDDIKMEESSLPRSDDTVDDNVCRDVANRIGIKWKALGRVLDLEKSTLDKITTDNKDVLEKAFQMLVAWKKKEAHKATVTLLAQHLKEVGRPDLAQNIVEKAKETSMSYSSPQGHK